MPKKKVIAARNLEDCLASLPLKTSTQNKKRQKENSKFFIATTLCLHH
jgi:hypothetical protein